MKRYDSEFVEDVEDLLEKVVLEEVTSAIWKTFESVLAQLDPESKKLLERHLNGTSTLELSRAMEMPEAEVQQWLNQIKRNLQQNIRKEFQVKQ
ncbi:MAG: hypothetical protein ACKOA8_12295 [Deltaproteobacteria bacterium]|jgi:DNA-directed RNA polymerase specialized sigma24 family protein